ncbi:LamG domain-containing protein [Streptomyces oceani]|uniref:LamG-like jellyroll fold domain-containing protein n=1 Tax=Streptomyces oceani TaxID=1075402 RepID=A0A1E7KIY3_9ACTN|nr:LamG domain-containing protein [Streptomyces oceani]OEV03899.1 hypothetical protein AN216_09650 [Streptomyces oceani]
MSPTAEHHASYDVLELRASSYARTAVDLGIALDGSVPYSIDGWMKLEGLCASASLLSQEGVFSFGIAGRSLVLSITGLPPVRSNPEVSALTSTDWHHVAVTYASNTFRLYIDGEFNTMQAVAGRGTHNGEPFLVGEDLQADLWSLRVFNTALTPDGIKGLMFGPADAASVVADFDFSVTPPVDAGPRHLPLVLEKGARMKRSTPALALSGTAFAEPLSDQHINPGGEHVDPYTVQAWVFVASATQARQAVFVNSDLESKTGMALSLDYDASVAGFRVLSQRGSIWDEDPLAATSVFPAGRWTNIATTFDGITLTIYVDGQPAGSRQFGPIPLSSARGRLLIGAALTAGQPFGAMTLQGFVSRLEVWRRALTATEIHTYMGRSPEPATTGLAADYDFTGQRARNSVDAHPVGLADGANLTVQRQAAGTGTPAPQGRASSPPPVFDLSDSAVRALCASIEPEPDLPELKVDLRHAMASDIAGFTTEDDRERVRTAWQEVLDGMDQHPVSRTFFVTSHVLDDHHVVLCHRRGHTHVAFRVPVGSVDECTLWEIRLVFIVVAGVLDAFFGLTTRLSDRAIQYIANFLRRPRIGVLLSQGKLMTGVGILSLAKALYEFGVLKELVTLIVDLGFWALLRVGVKLALKVMGVGAADVIASLAATVAAFIVEYSKKPESCEALSTVELSGIKFDYDPTATARDALSIRHNFRTRVPTVQWTKGLTTATQSPAAYALTRVTGEDGNDRSEVTLQARFVGTGQVSSMEVKAEGGGLLGRIDPFRVTLKDGKSDPEFVTIPLPHHTLAEGGVRREDIRWDWSYRVEDSWLPMGTTLHRVYVLLALPTLPWQLGTGSEQSQQPWTDLLDFACQWAEGTTDTTAAAAAITRKVNGEVGLRYDTDRGASRYTTGKGHESVFQGSLFLEYLRGGRGNGRTVNCTDCASIVTAFANVLGCDLTASTMYPIGGRGFACNKIQAIGFDDWAFPFEEDGGGRFSYHEVAWAGSLSYPNPLFDACLKVDSGHDPWNWTDSTITHTPMLPLTMPFTTLRMTPRLPIATPFDAESYRERLATNDEAGIHACIPQGPRPYTQNGRRRII